MLDAVFDPEETRLEKAILAAHETDDRSALARLYAWAGDLRERTGEIDAACFHLVHAYVYALEAGAPEAEQIRSRLAARGREA